MLLSKEDVIRLQWSRTNRKSLPIDLIDAGVVFSGEETWEEVREEVREETWDQTWDQTWRRNKQSSLEDEETLIIAYIVHDCLLSLIVVLRSCVFVNSKRMIESLICVALFPNDLRALSLLTLKVHSQGRSEDDEDNEDDDEDEEWRRRSRHKKSQTAQRRRQRNDFIVCRLLCSRVFSSFVDVLSLRCLFCSSRFSSLF